MKLAVVFVACDITQKGYEKKRGKLLAPYIPQMQGKSFMLITLLHDVRSAFEFHLEQAPEMLLFFSTSVQVEAQVPNLDEAEVVGPN
ncbi:disco-interacting protein 2 homolog A isoform X3 [Tachysurus ichikawai]